MTYTTVNPHACCNRPRPEDAHAAARPPQHPHASPHLTNSDGLRWKTDGRPPANGPPTATLQQRRHSPSTPARGPPRPPTPRPSPQQQPPPSQSQGQVPITEQNFSEGCVIDPSPLPPREQLCNRSCSNKHTRHGGEFYIACRHPGTFCSSQQLDVDDLEANDPVAGRPFEVVLAQEVRHTQSRVVQHATVRLLFGGRAVQLQVHCALVCIVHTRTRLAPVHHHRGLASVPAWTLASCGSLSLRYSTVEAKIIAELPFATPTRRCVWSFWQLLVRGPRGVCLLP
jgi:hypothetical protein